MNGAKLENAFVPVIAYLEWCGVKLDVNKWLSIMHKNEQIKAKALEELNNWLYKYTTENIKPGWVYKQVDIINV